MNYIITNNRQFFEKIGDYHYCNLEDMVLPDTIAVDTETTSLYPRKGDMFAVQIGTGNNNYLIDLQQLKNCLVFADVIPYLENRNLVFHNACLPGDTEVLTINGWKNIKNVTTDDTVYGWDNGNIVTQEVLSTIREKGEVFSLKNTGRHLRSTDDHRWLVKHNKKGTYSYKELQDLDYKYDQIVLNGTYNKEEGVNLTDDELRLFTWAITDGHIAKTLTKSMYSQIVITQSLKNGKYTKEIEETLQNLDLIYGESFIPMKGYSPCKRYFIGAKATRSLLSKIGYSDDFNFCEWVLSLSSKQIDIFVDIFQKAEGSNYKGRWSISQSKTKNKSKRDAICLALYLQGYTIQTGKKSIWGKKRIIADTRTLKKSSEGVQDVYCLMTSLTNFVMRQGEHIMLTGNCFDVGWFYKYDFWPEKIYDTMLASMILHNGDDSKRHSFKAVMERELGVVYDKTEQKNIHKVKLSSAAAIEYCFNDVDRLLDLMNNLVVKMKEYGVIPAFKLNCQYVRALAYMEQCGLPINKQKWISKCEDDLLSLAKEEHNVINYLYEKIPRIRDTQIDMFSTEKKILVNLMSVQQMIPLFQELGINTVSDDDPTKNTLSKDVIKRSTHEFASIWLKYKDVVHDVTTYGYNVLDKIEDGRIYTTFNPLLKTARISTRSKQFNSLNLPANEKTRVCFEAEQGKVLLVSDFDGQETIVGADLHKDPATLASVKEGKDLHCALARLIFPELQMLSDDEIKTNHKDKRQFSKAPRFAKAYGGGAFTIARGLNVPFEEGQRISNAYDELHASIVEWGEVMLTKAIENGYIESADGFKLKLPYYKDFMELHNWIENCSKNFWGDYGKGKKIYKAQLVKNELFDIESKYGIDSREAFDFKVDNEKQLAIEYNEYQLNIYTNNKGKISKYFKRRGEYLRWCLNFPVQSTSAFQTKKAVILLFNEIIKNNHLNKVKICVVPHDEIVIEVDADLVDIYQPLLGKCMRDGGNYYLKSGLVKMEAEANSGNNWYEAK